LTAQAGADVLAAGGNAVDAAVGAALVSWIAESPLTGPGAGGFMLVHRARDRSTRVFDFFVAVPASGSPRGPRRDGSRGRRLQRRLTQVFHIGAASCAVPAPPSASRKHTVPRLTSVARPLQPAIALARSGVELNNGQAYLHAILDLILRHTPESRYVYEKEDGERLVAEDRLFQNDLAETLELIAEQGGRVLYEGDLADAISKHVRDHGGSITERDLEEYRVIRRRPVRATFCGEEYLSNPPPSAGGILIAYGLPLLEELGPGDPGTAEAIDALARVMREQADSRIAAGSVSGLARALAERAAIVSRGTTHISVVDGQGNAVALTASTGAGSGIVVPGTGIHLNNMLGEFDLAKPPRPGARLSSMMSPSVVLRDGTPHLVVGSAGSLRLRGAVLQNVVNVVAHDLPVEDAIDRPRVHLEGEALHCEGGHDPAELDKLEEIGWNVIRWRRQNLYFGGASAVTSSDGELAAAGDPRRGGAGVVVE
jgi:gamma-glutamyltranspeptidase/glutathione hydrolase